MFIDIVSTYIGLKFVYGLKEVNYLTNIFILNFGLEYALIIGLFIDYIILFLIFLGVNQYNKFFFILNFVFLILWSIAWFIADISNIKLVLGL